ncbi:MAG: hypothetical protein SFV23_08435 [Planctomycetaceae bacterium]|nr:hypothetical protein [Planctomycetaceae bacterium]
MMEPFAHWVDVDAPGGLTPWGGVLLCAIIIIAQWLPVRLKKG